MRRYSHCFSTLHDEATPVAPLGRGAHCSIFRAVIAGPLFWDFAVIWDEDHDVRVIWVIEQMFAAGLLGSALFIGERKGQVTVLTERATPKNYATEVERIADSHPGDAFTSEVMRLEEGQSGIISDLDARVQAYLKGIAALWNLGAKPIQFGELLEVPRLDSNWPTAPR